MNIPCYVQRVGGGGVIYADKTVGVHAHALGRVGDEAYDIVAFSQRYVFGVGAGDAPAAYKYVAVKWDGTAAAFRDAPGTDENEAVYIQHASAGRGDGGGAYGDGPVLGRIVNAHAQRVAGGVAGKEIHAAGPQGAGLDCAVARGADTAGTRCRQGVDQAVAGIETQFGVAAVEPDGAVHRQFVIRRIRAYAYLAVGGSGEQHLVVGRQRGHRDRGAVLQFLGHYGVGHAVEGLTRGKHVAFDLHFKVERLPVGENVPRGGYVGAENALRGFHHEFGAGPAQGAAGRSVVDTEVNMYQAGYGGVVAFKAALVIYRAGHRAGKDLSGRRPGAEPGQGRGN